MEDRRPLDVPLTGLFERDLMGALAFDSTRLAVRSTPDAGNWIVGSLLEIVDDDGQTVKTLDTDGLSPDVASALLALRDMHGSVEMSADIPGDVGCFEDRMSALEGIVDGSVEAHFDEDGRFGAVTVRLLRHPDPRLWTRCYRFEQRVTVRVEFPRNPDDLDLYRACSLTGGNFDRWVVVTNHQANASVLARSGLHTVAVNWRSLDGEDLAIELGPKLGGRPVYVMFDRLGGDVETCDLRYAEERLIGHLELRGHTVACAGDEVDSEQVRSVAERAENGWLGRSLETLHGLPGTEE